MYQCIYAPDQFFNSQKIFQLDDVIESIFRYMAVKMYPMCCIIYIIYPVRYFYLSIYRGMHVNNKLINIKCISRDAPRASRG